MKKQNIKATKSTRDARSWKKRNKMNDLEIQTKIKEKVASNSGARSISLAQFEIKARKKREKTLNNLDEKIKNYIELLSNKYGSEEVNFYLQNIDKKISNLDFLDAIGDFKSKVSKYLNPKKIVGDALKDYFKKDILQEALKLAIGGKKALVSKVLSSGSKLNPKTLVASGISTAKKEFSKAAGSKFTTITFDKNSQDMLRTIIQKAELEKQEFNVSNADENNELSEFAYFSSSWMKEGIYDKQLSEMFVRTKPTPSGRTYAFVVKNVTPRIWETIKTAASAGEALWDTAWASKRTKSVSAPAWSGIVRGGAANDEWYKRSENGKYNRRRI